MGTLDENSQFTISDYCPGNFEELTVTKTAVTFYTRTHEWDIDKKVETDNGYELDGYSKIWLYVDGHGDETATWTVDVTYEGYQDSAHNVSGTITIENTGALDAVITAVVDQLAGTTISVTWPASVSFPYTLPVGETISGTYSKAGYVEGTNVVTVTTERDTYTDDAAIVWGSPTTEVNKTITVVDESDIFETVTLGTVTAPNNGKFTYDKAFAWIDYGAAGHYEYDNTATIVETGQDASAKLLVNVQGFVYKTAYAKGAAGLFKCFAEGGFSQWGWTNRIEPGYSGTWDLRAGAAKCDTSKGTLVGSVTVAYEDGFVTMEYNVELPYTIAETHVYAGTTMFPKQLVGKRLVDTVAPGQYTNVGPFTGPVYVIAHAVVGTPDPSFGPTP